MNKRHHAFRSRVLAYATAGAFSALGAAMTVSPATAQAGKVEKPDITFGVFPINNYGVVYLSIQQGFFQEEGLNVAPRMMGGNPVAGIIGGDFDTGGVTWTAFLLAINRGVPLVPLSESDRGALGQGLFMVKNESPIKDVSDLVGKKIGVPTVGGACDLILNDVLLKKGLDYKSIGYTVVGVPDMAPIVLRGGLDAACIPEPMLSKVQAQGGLRSVFDMFSQPEHERFPLIGFPVTQKFAETNPNTVAALKRALAKGLKFAHHNPDKLRAIYPTFVPITQEEARKIVISYTPEVGDFTQLKKIADMMDRLQMVPGKTKLPDVALPR
ncbi:MAG TPA: ABC transporter substrate-binding protein [Blastocatellia bacterium]|nr:ABC transporter substrate-binding protein [Blastocatellia bacterium]